MNTKNINIAASEAKRFLMCVDRFNFRMRNDGEFNKYYNITGGKETSALKRSSLDLSRALSAMRGAV